MQLEFATDAERRKLVIYVLESGTQKPHPIPARTMTITFDISDQKIPVNLDADPQTDDSPGKASRFSISLDKLPKPLQTAADFVAEFSLEIEGDTVSGTLTHHDDHTHNYHHD